jgi:benzodiazapine receptor
VIPGSPLPLPLALAVATVAVGLCATLGRAFTTRAPRGWYDALAKPPWTPSGRTIGIVWSVLFATIGVSAALVWNRAFDLRFTSALALNLVLNAAWWWLFFARRWPSAALAELVVLEVTSVALALLAARVSTAAGWLLLPYALYLVFAGALNAAIVRRNRPGRP